MNIVGIVGLAVILCIMIIVSYWQWQEHQPKRKREHNIVEIDKYELKELREELEAAKHEIEELQTRPRGTEITYEPGMAKFHNYRPTSRLTSASGYVPMSISGQVVFRDASQWTEEQWFHYYDRLNYWQGDTNAD